MKTEKYECSHCGKSFDKPTKLGGHVVYCKHNPTASVRKTPSLDKYLTNPKKCKHCGILIPFDKRGNVFCSSTCAAIHNNLKRDSTVYTSLSNTLKSKISEIPMFRSGKKYASYGEMIEGYYDTPSMCKNCNSVLSYDMRKRKTCSHMCKVQYLSIIQKNRIDENPNIHPNVLCSKIRDKRSYPETVLEDYLLECGLVLGVDFIPQYKIGRYMVDFYIPYIKTIIEVNGRYWHNLESDREMSRTEYLKNLGTSFHL
jgi:very-short-patch-repair endonuclease